MCDCDRNYKYTERTSPGKMNEKARESILADTSDKRQYQHEDKESCEKEKRRGGVSCNKRAIIITVIATGTI